MTRRHARRVAGHLRRSTSRPPRRSRRYREFAAQKSELERQAEGQEKTGVFTGAFAMNPINGWHDPDLHRRLRADGLRHRGDHGGARATTSATSSSPRSSTCPIVGVVRPPDDWLASAASTPTRRRRMARGLHRRRRRHELGERRASRSTACASPTPRTAIIDWLGGERGGRGRGHLQAARLAVQPAALLGRAVPDRLRRRRPARSRCPSRCCRSSCPRSPTSSPRILADDDTALPSRRSHAPSDWVHVELDLGDGRAATYRARDQHHAAVGRLVLVLPALPRPHERRRARRSRDRAATGWARPVGRRRPLRRRRRARGAAPPLRALLAQGAVRPRPRVDARAVPPAVQPGHDHRRPRTPTSAACTSRRRRSRSATARSSTTAPRSSGATARWARA